MNVTEDASRVAMDYTTDHDTVFRESQFTRITPKSQAPLMLHSKRSGLMYDVSCESIVNNRMEMTTRGIVHIIPNGP